jgi:hypothetical protein
MKTLSAIAIFAITAAGMVHAQDASLEARRQAAIEAKQQYVGAASPDTSTTCAFTFTSGTGNKFLKYCVTKNGNIVHFESPSGVNYISTAPIGEGYAFCDFDTSTPYYDYAGFGDSGNWQAPVTVSSSATSVKINRTTTDGIYTLTQTITQNAGNALAQVSMSIKNNSTAAHHVGLLRWADVDAQGFTGNSFDYTFRTAMGYNQGGDGLLLQWVSGSPFNGAYSQDIPGGPNSCQIFMFAIGPLANTDGSVFAQWDFELAAKAAKSAVMTYKAF